MTREEAIYILKNTAWLGSAELAGDVTEAVKMAVNVLKRSEAPNSSDTISRQAVLQRLTDIAYNSCKTEGQAQVIDWAKTLVCVMPSAQPQRTERWIPFTTRPLTEEEKEEHPEWDCILDCKLPDDGQQILVSVSVRGHERVQYDEFVTDDGSYLDSGYEIGTEAVTWMPLPEPYQEEGGQE